MNSHKNEAHWASNNPLQEDKEAGKSLIDPINIIITKTGSDNNSRVNSDEMIYYVNACSLHTGDVRLDKQSNACIN